MTTNSDIQFTPVKEFYWARGHVDKYTRTQTSEVLYSSLRRLPLPLAIAALFYRKMPLLSLIPLGYIFADGQILDSDIKKIEGKSEEIKSQMVSKEFFDHHTYEVTANEMQCYNLEGFYTEGRCVKFLYDQLEDTFGKE
ncbi:MAG: hypothetical protein VX777_07485 [Chlamydiota bacterium]|nr:hypothetical protein [Chlamydiota bacterium]